MGRGGGGGAEEANGTALAWSATATVATIHTSDQFLGLKGRRYLLLTLLHTNFPPVVGMVFSAIKEGKLGVVLLLGHRHPLKLSPVPCNEVGQLVNDGLHLRV